MLMIAERSRSDPAFQHQTRDAAVIERETRAVPGAEAWSPCEIEIDGVAKTFQRQDRGGDWIAFHDLGTESVYVHVEQPDGYPVAIVTLTDVTPYMQAPIDYLRGSLPAPPDSNASSSWR